MMRKEGRKEGRQEEKIGERKRKRKKKLSISRYLQNHVKMMKSNSLLCG